MASTTRLFDQGERLEKGASATTLSTLKEFDTMEYRGFHHKRHRVSWL